MQHFLLDATVQGLLDPGKGKDCNNYNSFSFHVHNTSFFLNVLSTYVNYRKFVEENVHGGLLVSKSRNIALKLFQ